MRRVDRERLGETDDAPLRRGIGGAQRKAETARGRGQVRDARVAARLEERNRAPCAEEVARQVDRERALPIGKRDVLARGRGSGDARIVDERVESAERGGRRGEEALDRSRVRDIAFDLAQRRVARRERRERGSVDVADEDPRAFPGERACGGEADAGSARR